MILLDGKKTAQEIIDNVKLSLQNHKTKPAIAVILANDEHASRIYVKSKQKRCEELSINSHLYEFAKNSKTSDIIELIEKLNNDKSINGILVQLPLFKHLDVQKIIEKISPIKDVDAFSSYNVSRLWTGLKPYSFPCTPYGILLLAKKYGIDF
ncbi:bifunctional methylenetetrahydrofolate dehydrogenase/methenyltetrahydrofolate cyclohydrolase, partial [bacterium]|nr:bifunctional methylenetetrahydrofolate dehydrogenase/methenyltetrahydrofolate cyclohydrolase [bacterium]